jgi:hypothetical protein
MSYWIAFIADGWENVTYSSFSNKDEVIEFLMAGHSAENWTQLHTSRASCQDEVAYWLGHKGMEE